MRDLTFLDGYAGEFSPQSPSQLPLLDNIPDGDYDCTIVSAVLTETQKQGKDIVKIEVQFDAINKIAEKVYFLGSVENVNRMAGDFGTLGFEVAKWGKEIKLSDAIPAAVAKLPGYRFKGTKKANASNGKIYHNLYINAPLGIAANAQELQQSNTLKQFSEGKDEDPF